MKHAGLMAAAATVALVFPVAVMTGRATRPLAAAEQAAAAPAHRVIACYFHRTVRCPTCKRISAYIEEATQAGFSQEIKDGRVAVEMIDFQNPKNQRYTNYYQISGPTLVILDIRDNKVVAWKPAPKVWSLVAKKGEFFQYVQDEIRGYLDSKRGSEVK